MTMSPALRRSLSKLFAAQLYYYTDRLADRAKLAARVARCAEDGLVAIVYGGCDCDGSSYSGYIDYVPAVAIAVVHWERQRAKWADGPYSFRVAKPSEVTDSSVYS